MKDRQTPRLPLRERAGGMAAVRNCAKTSLRVRGSLVARAALVALLFSSSAYARDFYAATDGLPTNDGSLSRPLDLATALSANGGVRPGDTIWVRGGTYRGEFVANLNGTATQPIIVRNYNGERAAIDTRKGGGAGLTIYGSYTWYWGLEIMSSGQLRRTPYAEWNELDRGMGIRNNGTAIKIINNIIHDTALGVSQWGTWTSNPDLEAYGNLIYYNGWEQIPPGNAGRGHGHGFYTLSKQNGNTKLKENVIHTQFSQGIRMGDEGVFDPFIEGNIAYQNGSHMYLFGGGRNIYVGGSNGTDYGQYLPLYGAVIRSNYTYFASNSAPYAEGLNLGLWWPGASGEVSNNYFAGLGGGDALALGYYDSAAAFPCAKNTVYGTTTAAVHQQCPDSSNTYYASKPTANAIFVRPNQYEPGRANIAVYNWKQQNSVTVNLSAARLSDGQAFEVRDAMNYYGPAVARGTFSTASPTVTLPMVGLVRAPMTGENDVTASYRPKPHTLPEFGAFILLPVQSGSTPPLPPTEVKLMPIS